MDLPGLWGQLSLSRSLSILPKPFGEEQGQQFTTNLREGKIVGFHGRKGLYLDAIGVHVVEGKVTPTLRLPPITFHQNEAVEGKITLPIPPPFNSSSQAEVPAKYLDKLHRSNKLGLARRGPTDEVLSSSLLHI